MDKIKLLIYRLLRGYSPFKFLLVVNITNRCNRRCSFCAYQSPAAADNEFNRWWKSHPMDIAAVQFISHIRILRPFIKSISLTGKGEPLLHKKFMLICHSLEWMRIPFTITTNGDYLTDAIIDRLQSLKYMRYIRVSAYEPETIKRFADIDRVMVMNFTGQDDTKELTGLYGIKGKGIRENFNHNTHCRTPFSFFTLYTDGSITSCYSWLPLSNLYRDSAWKIWNGRKVREFRRIAIRDRNLQKTDCVNCLYNKDNP